MNAPSAATGEAKHLRVLLCDDDLANRELFRAMLLPAGMTVDAFADAASAIEALKRGVYDVVLMDVMMQGMSGMEAARAIRRLPGAVGSVPIIGVTARSSAEAMHECLAAGMNHVLIKPIRRMELLGALSELARHIR
jgi:CheY-like chemotaxis protein